MNRYNELFHFSIDLKINIIFILKYEFNMKYI